MQVVGMGLALYKSHFGWFKPTWVLSGFTIGQLVKIWINHFYTLYTRVRCTIENRRSCSSAPWKGPLMETVLQKFPLNT